MYEITLTDGEEAALRAVAAQTGQTIEALVHRAVAAQYPIFSARFTTQASENERLLALMRARGHLVSEGEALSPEEEALEASLPPYGSAEEAALLQQLAGEAGEAFRAAGTTGADAIIRGRGE
jgi:hypothetical protein